MRSVEVYAYAKVNLSLDIVGRREDGYHTVDMVMQSVSLCDCVCVTLNDTGEITLSCSKPHIPTDIRNTAYKAAQFFLDAAGLHFGADIRIEKNVPDQAGMGGGSADAAAVLRALNILCEQALGEAPLNTAELLYLGMRIGADVPFCILNGTRRCGGVGEIMLPLADMPACGLVIVKPDVSISTPEAYRQCDTKPDSGVRYTGGMVQAVEGRSLAEIAQRLGNRFDDALQIPQVQQIKAALLAGGALNAVMTGSGSAVFGIYQTPEQAERAAAQLDPALGERFTAVPIASRDVQVDRVNK